MLPETFEFIAINALPKYKLTIDRVFESYYGLQFVDAGGVELHIDDQKYIMEGQWLWCTYPGPHFVYKPLKKHGYWSHHYITFKGSRAEEWAKEGLIPFAPQQIRSSAQLGARIEHIQELSFSGNQLDLLYAINEVERILLDRASMASDTSQRPLWLQDLIEQLNNSYKEQPRYDELAAQYCMSVSTLRRQFKLNTGIPIHTYLINRRINAACELLIHTNMPLKTIAEHLGYKDIYFFNRQFRQYKNLTPSQFRQHK